MMAGPHSIRDVSWETQKTTPPPHTLKGQTQEEEVLANEGVP